MKALINACVCTTSLRIRNNVSMDESPHKCLCLLDLSHDLETPVCACDLRGLVTADSFVFVTSAQV